MRKDHLQQLFITPSWPAPPNVKALQTTRAGGVSLTPFNSLNLGAHVQDNPSHVAHNRQLLSQFLPSEPVWLSQVHGVHVIDAGNASCAPEADASFSTKKNVVCVTMTADCLPILLCDTAGSVVASIHAGWRSLCDGVVEATVHEICHFKTVKSADLMAWLGPAIGANAFEVGSEVRAQFMQKDAQAELAFIKHGDKYLGNLYQLATQRLNNCGISQIFGGGHNEQFCTVSETERFFSYRRDGATGRMATLIWLS